ncbi:MAG: hypothetical protein K2N05_11175 [Muribaculaceae bacterium]|nr:hypothetical protein [Muribaculaceae bacterium]
MEYILDLKTEDDYRIIKKILHAFHGATIRPRDKTLYNLEKALEEVENGDIVGPFASVDDLMADLLS